MGLTPNERKEWACRVCGCTNERACVDIELGPCWWVEDDLCSHCEIKMGECPECGCDANFDNENYLCNDCMEEMNKVSGHKPPTRNTEEYPADDLPF